MTEIEKRSARSGVETGGRIIWLLEHGDVQVPSAGAIADRLGLEESYVRRVCQTLTRAGLLSIEEMPQRGTPPVKVYSVIQPRREC